jgi:RNA recognition motif-containing protein
MKSRQYWHQALSQANESSLVLCSVIYPLFNSHVQGQGRRAMAQPKKEAVMAKRIYVGNLSFNSTKEEVESAFAQYGEVLSVDMIMDKFTGKPRGFCFVEMENAEEAIVALNGKELGGRNLTVNEARERTSRAAR